MKKFKKLMPVIILVLVLLLSSCTINHPLYTSNYRVEWRDFKGNNSKHIIENNKAQNKIDSENTATTAIVNEQTYTSLTQDAGINDNNTASADRSIIILPTKKLDFNKKKESTKKTNTARYANERKAKIDDRKLSPLKKMYQKIRKTTDALKALFIFILLVALTGLALAFISLFGSYFLFIMIVGGVILLTLGILIILVT
jgi:lipopolysaccharide export LptBFGC system permease protein LptF